MQEEDFNDQFVKEYSKLVYSAIRNKLRKYGHELPHEEMLDIMQDTFTDIFQSGKLLGVRNDKSIPYWIAIVSGNTAMQHMRKKRRIEPEPTLSIFTKSGGLELADIIPCSGPCLYDELDRSEISAKIESAMESLRPRERLIIKLNLIHGKKYEEISCMLAIPIGTVSNHIKRAKDKLKIYLKDLK